MARTLRDPPPTSSLARLLDNDAAARAISRHRDSVEDQYGAGAAPINRGAQPEARSSTEWPDVIRPSRIKREVLLCCDTDETLDEVVRMLRLSTRSRVTTSHVVRALLRALSRRLDEIRRQAVHLGPRRLPSNSAGSEHARRDFEEALATIFFAETDDK